MKAILGFLVGLFFCLLATALQVAARPPQEAPPPQNSPAAQGANPAQVPGRGGDRRPSLFGKLTAVHDQSVEIAQPSGDTVTVKFGASTQFRKDGEAAKLGDLKVGDVVFVRGAENSDHTWNAEVIGTRTGGSNGGPGGAGGGRGGPGGGGMRPAGVLGQDYIFGEVKVVDAPKLTILRPDNVSQTVELNEETSLRKGRDSVTMADIQVGDHIMVRGGMVNNVFQPNSVMVIGPEQWKRMQELGIPSGAPPANPPKDNTQPQKPPEPQH